MRGGKAEANENFFFRWRRDRTGGGKGKMIGREGKVDKK